MDFKFWRKNYGIWGKFYSHIPADQVRHQIGDRLWKKYQKITIHRNPFDFIVSKYFFTKEQKRQQGMQHISFKQWFEEEPEIVQVNIKIAPLLGPNVADVILRYEFLEEDIKRHLPEGFWDIFSRINAKGNLRPNSSRDLDKFFHGQHKIVNQISELCKEEIDFFNYRIPKP